jgi:rfaE bifunctional protein nucleotidyltransferase chain/domain
MINFSNQIESKILTWSQLEKQLGQWHFKSQKIIFTNGCFDILHQGHIDYLSQAASLGNKLIIGLNSDESVKRLKGEGRPINNQLARAKVLSALMFTSVVVIFDQDTPHDLIKLVKPHVLVKGGDYSLDMVIGKEFAYETVIIPFTTGFSTTRTIEKLKS